MNLSAPFIRRPVMTTFVMLAILIAGILSFLKLPVSDLPTIEHPEIEIKAGYPGASPETILYQVTIPLEKELNHVKGIQEIISRSNAGGVSLSLKFDLNKNMDQAIRDVQAALSRAESYLPRDLNPRPYYHRQQGSQDPIMYALMISDTVSLGDLRMYADTYIIPRLSRLEGVAQVMAFGEKKSVWVKINPELMAARRLGFNDIMDAITHYSSQIPMGSIQTGSKVLAIELETSLQEAKQLENIEVGSSHVKLKEIAEVSEKASDGFDFHYLTADRRSPALILGIQKISDANTVAVSKSIKDVLEQIKGSLPPTIAVSVWFDKAVWIHESILDVEWSLLIAFGLVIVVIYLSLGRLSEALIPSAALPLSLIGTFSVMYLLDFSLDLLSLLALTLSVGFVVDDAIVVLENIVRHQEAGENPREASFNGSKQICFTVVSMTLSLVAVFIPLLFMPGMTGRLFREFSVTLAVSILVSGFISLTLIPMLCSRFLKQHTGQTYLQNRITAANDWMVKLYGSTLKICLCFSKSTLLVALACVIAMVPLFMKLPVKLVPSEDRGFFFSFVRLPTGISKEEVKGYQGHLETLLQQNSAIESFLDIYFGGNIVLAVRLKPLNERSSQSAVIKGVNKQFDAIPGIMAFTHGYNLINLDLDFGSGGQYQFIVKGETFDAVDKAAQNLAQVLQVHPDFASVQAPQKNDSPKLLVHVDEERANLLGISKRTIQGFIQSVFGQSEAATIRKGAHEHKVYLELQKEYQNNPDVLSSLYFTAGENLIPLRSVIDWKESLGSPNLIQRDQLPSASIKFSLKDHVPPQEGLRVVEDTARQTLPENVSGHFHGTANAVASTMNHTLYLLLAAALVMYVVLGILYESFIHPLTILSSLPFAGLGGVLTLLVFGEPLSIFSAVGFLLLLGLVKKNGIMMVDYAIENEKKGMDPSQAIFEGCLARFRPIMMTTIAAVMGALPIAIGFGDGSETRRGLGLVIAGGLLFSQLLTLYVTPVIYLALTKSLKDSKVQQTEHPTVKV